MGRLASGLDRVGWADRRPDGDEAHVRHADEAQDVAQVGRRHVDAAPVHAGNEVAAAGEGDDRRPVLGAHLPDGQRIATFAWKAEKAFMSETGPTPPEARRRVNEWKNEVKHMRNDASRTVVIDPEFAAEYHIEQALINFEKLPLKNSAAVRKFEDHQGQRDRAGR